VGELETDLRQLWSGPINWFSDWPCGDVPRSGSIVYTIWNKDEGFIYVGMSGRQHTLNRPPSPSAKGPWGRLDSHAKGRRSGDQFCVYVCDRLVLRTLHNRIQDIADGTLSLDAETQDYVRANLGFRWITATDGNSADRIERSVQRGEAPCGPPILNPL
jgi:hypothetical protein